MAEPHYFFACLNENKILVRYLVEFGVDVHIIDRYGNTLLFNACLIGYKL